jgi:hypothetical protein
LESNSSSISSLSRLLIVLRPVPCDCKHSWRTLTMVSPSFLWSPRFVISARSTSAGTALSMTYKQVKKNWARNSTHCIYKYNTHCNKRGKYIGQQRLCITYLKCISTQQFKLDDW